jgi:predicted Zn-dependent protease
MWNQLNRFFHHLRKKWIYVFLSVAIAITSIAVTPHPSYGSSWLDILIRGVQIIQLSSISDEQEVSLGKQIDGQLVQQRKIRILRNSSLNSYLNQIGQRLVRTSDRSDIPYKFQIVNDRQINAFATMGGYVYINSGLMQVADNEAELASVVAHEIGHIASRHAIKQMREAAISQGLLTAAGLEEETIVNIGVQLAVSLPNSRGDEYEADQLGLVNLQKAGYAPSAMVSFMRKLMKRSGSVPTFLSTHPNVADRVVALEKAIDPKIANQGDGLDSQSYKNRIQAAL